VRVWVDLVNSPQVLTLQPIIRELRRRGHDVEVTTRDFAQTVQLADRIGLSHTPLGRHGGASRLQVVRVTVERAALLVRHRPARRADLALSHNSYSQAIAARLLGIPFVTMMDYEHTRANHLAFRLAHRVLVPAVFPRPALRAFGAARKTVRYPGLKEELYLGDFRPAPDFRQATALPEDRPLVVMRPPGSWAEYHRGRGDLFRAALRRILADPSPFVVYLPRIQQQAALVRDVPPSRLLIPATALDGPNLIYHADLVVSAGGTMNREAAVLGTPACTVFEGRLGAVDRALVAAGRLRRISGESDLDTLKIEKRQGPKSLPVSGSKLTKLVTDAVLGTVC
jgi:predicted glycosyltransferase